MGQATFYLKGLDKRRRSVGTRALNLKPLQNDSSLKCSESGSKTFGNLLLIDDSRFVKQIKSTVNIINVFCIMY